MVSAYPCGAASSHASVLPQGLPILVTVLISFVPRQVGGWLRGQERPVMSSCPCFLPFSWKEVISSQKSGESGSPTQGMAGLGVAAQCCEDSVVAWLGRAPLRGDLAFSGLRVVGVAVFLKGELDGRGNWSFSSSLLVQAAKSHSQGCQQVRWSVTSLGPVWLAPHSLSGRALSYFCSQGGKTAWRSWPSAQLSLCLHVDIVLCA